MELAIKQTRESMGVSVPQLAEMTGLSKEIIWNLEAGRSKPSAEYLCMIADALDVSLDLLVRGKEKDRPKGRSVQAILDEYKGMSSEEITLISYVLQTELANRAFQDHLRQDEKQNP